MSCCTNAPQNEFETKDGSALWPDASPYEAVAKELTELKEEINRVWYLAYPESTPDTKDVAKMRIFNLFQDLNCTRFNLRVLQNGYNELDTVIENAENEADSQRNAKVSGSGRLHRSESA